MIIQLQSILLPEDNTCAAVPELYCHKNGSRIDFDGYFNLLYIEKRKTYTAIDNLKLRIHLKGYQQLIICHDRTDLRVEQLDSSIDSNLCIEFPYMQYQKGVFWFALIEDEQVDEKHIRGFYTTEVDEKARLPVHIGINICTYKREEEVQQTIMRLKGTLLDKKSLDVSDFLNIYVIDNGQTLQDNLEITRMAKQSDGKIRIIANPNVGGAGGFTRGLLEILKDKPSHGLTHVLMMDDDVFVEPDAVVRIYGMLSTLREEWKDVTIGGSMWRTESPHMLFCAGERWEKGKILASVRDLDMRSFENAASPALTTPGEEFVQYSGWWCCCYSLATVRNDNLPLPLFVHFDDTEFGLRNQKTGVVFCNGIGVWHKGFDTEFSGSKIYYDIRNVLMEFSFQDHLSKREQRNAAEWLIIRSMVAQFFRMRFKDVFMAYQGVQDFLKGPDWVFSQKAELLHKKVSSFGCKMQPMEEIKLKLTQKELQCVESQINKIRGKSDMDIKKSRREEDQKGMLCKIITLNGWLLPPERKRIQVLLPTDSPLRAFRKKRILLYEPHNKKAHLASRKSTNLFTFLRLCIKVHFALQKGYAKTAESYCKKAAKYTNRKAWEEYLRSNGAQLE